MPTNTIYTTTAVITVGWRKNRANGARVRVATQIKRSAVSKTVRLVR